MRHTKKLISLALLSTLSTGAVYASLTVSGLDNKVSSNPVENTETGNNLVKFKDGENIVKTMFVPDNYSLSLEDVPFVDKTNTDTNTTTYYTWVDGANNYINNHINVTDDITLTATEVSSDMISTEDASYSENLQPGSQDISKVKNDVKFDKYVLKNTVTATVSKIDGSSYTSSTSYSEAINVSATDTLNTVNLKLNYDSKPNLGKKSSTNKYDVPGKDSTISLESVDGTTSTYKPNIGNTKTENSTNYLVSKFTLTSDMILDSSFTLGAITGYAALNTDYRQQDMQGMIVGAYSELDLNGHDLIITDGGMLDAFGSVTDSSADRSGSIVLKKGGLMYTPMVIEDHYSEFSMLGNLQDSAMPFNLYRCPYLDCTVKFESGSNFYGKMKLSLSGSGSTAVGTDVHFIGNDTTSLIQFKDDNGYIKDDNGYVQMTTSYDESYLDGLSGDTLTKAKNNLLHQRIEISGHDANLEFNNMNFDVSFSGVKGNFDSYKYQFFISPYYDIKLFNTTLTVKSELVFMPGSTFYSDANSEIVLSNTDIYEFDAISGGLFHTVVPAQQYQGVGGISMITNMHSYAEYFNSIIKSSDNTGYAEGKIVKALSDFYLNLKPAVANIEGKITIAPKEGTTQFIHNFAFGGIINISDLNYFNSQVETNKEHIQLYSSDFSAARNWFNKKLISPDGGTNVSGYYNQPLMMEETGKYRVLMDLIDQSKLNFVDQNYYDIVTKLITTSENKTYGFIFNSYGQATNLYRAYYKDDNSKLDSLSGIFKEVSYDTSTHIMTLDRKNYINFRGAFIPSNGSSYDLSIFAGTKASVVSISSFKYSNNRWIVG